MAYNDSLELSSVVNLLHIRSSSRCLHGNVICWTPLFETPLHPITDKNIKCGTLCAIVSNDWSFIFVNPRSWKQVHVFSASFDMRDSIFQFSASKAIYLTFLRQVEFWLAKMYFQHFMKAVLCISYGTENQ